MPKMKITKAVSERVETKMLSDTEIENAVEFINEKANETVFKGSIEIGQYILEKFFDNDINALTSIDVHIFNFTRLEGGGCMNIRRRPITR